MTNERPAAEPPPGRATRARLDAVFGDVLPESTGDDRQDGSDRARSDPDGAQGELYRWYQENRPPHHGSR